MKKALITGILGQDGPYLAKLLLEKNYKVYGLIRRYTNPNFSNLDFLGITNQVEYVLGDMGDEASISNLIRSLRPDEVYNLAAQSFVGSSWDIPMVTTDINAIGPLRILNAIKHFSPHTKFYQASTSEIYGNSNTDGQQNENTAFIPKSPYAIAKLLAFWSTVNYRESYGIFAANGILFNHESPLRGYEFVTRKISKAVAAISLGKAEYLTLGNLDAERDWGFAGDYVDAMWRILQHDKADDFVVATGVKHSINDFLVEAFKHVGISDWQKHIKTDPRFKRPNEVHSLKGDASKAKKELNWQSTVSFDELVRMMVDADLERLKNENSPTK